MQLEFADPIHYSLPLGDAEICLSGRFDDLY